MWGSVEFLMGQLLLHDGVFPCVFVFVLGLFVLKFACGPCFL